MLKLTISANKLLLLQDYNEDKWAAMDNFGDGANAIVAGASGLVGEQVLSQLLALTSISSVTALVRNRLPIQNNKLNQIQNSDLAVTQWNDSSPSPDIGFICLGSTIKQAGSKSALKRVDVDLVTQVAQTMQMLGVKRIAVISSYGANPDSFSHYLKCKGRMEQNLLRLSFQRVVFLRPGPLVGIRQQPRFDEKVLQKLLWLTNPLLLGPLANFKPIQASSVAQAMIFSLIKPTHHPTDNYCTLNTNEIHALLTSYQVPN